MPKSSAINLLKAKTVLSPQLLAIEGQLRVTSLIVLTALFLAGIFFGVGYAILRGQYADALARKETFAKAISRELQKEGLFMTLKDRIGIAGRIIEGQHAWLGVLDLINRLTRSGNRTSFSVNENDEVNLTITSPTLEETFGVVNRILTEVADKTIANPVLESVQYQKDGSVRMTMVFTPIF